MACKRCKTISFTSLHNMHLVEVTCPRQQSPAQHAVHCRMKHSEAVGEYTRPYTVASGRNTFIDINAGFSGVRVGARNKPCFVVTTGRFGVHPLQV